MIKQWDRSTKTLFNLTHRSTGCLLSRSSDAVHTDGTHARCRVGRDPSPPPRAMVAAPRTYSIAKITSIKYMLVIYLFYIKNTIMNLIEFIEVRLEKKKLKHFIICNGQAARGCHQPFHFIRPSPLSFLLSAFSGAFYLSSMIAMATCSSCYEDASDYDICIACVSSPLILVSTMMWMEFDLRNCEWHENGVNRVKTRTKRIKIHPSVVTRIG